MIKKNGSPFFFAVKGNRLMNNIVRITKYLRSFTIETNDLGLKSLLEGFNHRLIESKLSRDRGEVVQVEGDNYAIYNEVKDRYHYSYNQLTEIKELIRNHRQSQSVTSYKLEEVDNSEVDFGVDVNFDRHNLSVMEPEGSKFEFQNDIIAFTTREGYNHDILEVQTGLGKTAMAMKTIADYGKRTLLLTKAGYIDKWIGDLTDGDKPSLCLSKKELIRVKGNDALNTLIELGKEDKLDDCKVILISSHTLDNWFNTVHKVETCYDPLELLKILGVGFLVYDESHELFRMNYWSYLLLNPPKCLDLTATLIPGKNNFLVERYRERFPKQFRYDGLAYDKYIDAYSIYYHLDDQKIKKRMRGLKMYNHIELEKAIQRAKFLVDKYFSMILELMDIFFFKNYKEGQKILLLFGSQNMCTKFRDFLKQKSIAQGTLINKIANQQGGLDIVRYIQGDNYKEFVAADIGISTPGKAGTAVDIPGLITTICTVAMGKEDKNLQILGRTRKPKDGSTPRVVYIHCQQIRKHIAYLNTRMSLFEGRVNSFKVLNSNFRI